MSASTVERDTAFTDPPRGRPQPGLAHYARKGLKALASLRLTVGLFVFSILLVFFGIRSYRENAGGLISFGRAVAVGILITLI